MTGYAHPESLATPQWLAEHLHDDNVRVVEVGWGDGPDFGRPGYDQSHIYGAIAWDFAQDLQTPGPPGVFVESAAMQELLSRSGVGSETIVVVYSELENLFATFAFWLLKVHGHGNVRLLDGDKRKWLDEGRLTRTVAPVVAPMPHPTPTPNWRLRARYDEVLAALGQANTLLVDTRSPEMFAGQDTAGTAHGRHIPGAVNLAASREVQPDGSFGAWRVPTVNEDGTFKSHEELLSLVGELGITPERDIITYCVRGGLSTHAWFRAYRAPGPPKRA